MIEELCSDYEAYGLKRARSQDFPRGGVSYSGEKWTLSLKRGGGSHLGKMWTFVLYPVETLAQGGGGGVFRPPPGYGPVKNHGLTRSDCTLLAKKNKENT